MSKIYDVMSVVGAFMIGGALFTAGTMSKACASERQPYGFVVVQPPATVPGIRDASPRLYYQGKPVVMQRPSASVYHLTNEAPPNGCEGQGGGFRIESGLDAGRCVGAR